MKTSKKEKAELRILESLIEQFLNEQMEFESLAAAEIAVFHALLFGNIARNPGWMSTTNSSCRILENLRGEPR